MDISLVITGRPKILSRSRAEPQKDCPLYRELWKNRIISSPDVRGHDDDVIGFWETYVGPSF